MDAEQITSFLKRRFPIPDYDLDSIRMSQLRDSLWGKGDEHLSELCLTLDSQALHGMLSSRPASPPPVSRLAESRWEENPMALFRFTSPFDISPEEYAIPPDQKFAFLDTSNIPYLSNGFSRVLIRDDYETLFEGLCSIPRERCGGVAIRGQSGIGKSLCLYYLLIRRLLRGLPVALQIVDGVVLLFLESGTYVIRDADTLNFLPEGIWALVDSDQSKEAPAAFLSYPSSPFFIVQAQASECMTREWQKYKFATTFYMRPWDWDEIVFAAPFQPGGGDLTLMGLRFVYNLLGPSPRVCYAAAESYPYIAGRIMEIKNYLGLNYHHTRLQAILQDLEWTPYESSSHHIFCILPGSQSPWSCTPRCDFTSKYLGRLMIDRWVAKDEERLREMRTAFKNHGFPVLGVGSGCLFEQFAHTTISQGFDGAISELPITPRDNLFEYDTNIRQAAGHTHFEPRISTVFDMTHFPIPTETFYYIPTYKNQAAFDSFIIHNGRVMLFQTTVGGKHDVLATGLDRLENALPQPSYDLIVVVRKDQRANGAVPCAWVDKLRLFVMELEDEAEAEVADKLAFCCLDGPCAV